MARCMKNDYIKAESNTYFAMIDKAYYTEGIKKLESRWYKIEKLENVLNCKGTTLKSKENFCLPFYIFFVRLRTFRNT